jgi:hypothetical protein
MELSRRGLITGLITLIAAPAIVRASSLMDIRGAPLFPQPIMWWGLREPPYNFSLAAVELRRDDGVVRTFHRTPDGRGVDLEAVNAFKGTQRVFLQKLYNQVGLLGLEAKGEWGPELK